MKSFPRTVAWLFCSAFGGFSLCAQTPPAATPAPIAADATPVAPADVTPPPAASPSPEEQAAAKKAVVLAEASEALGLVSAAESGDRSQSSRLAALVDALRANPDVPEYDRYVLVARTTALTMKPVAKDRAAKFAAYADLARKLIAEFPNQAEPYASLLALAEDSPAMGAAGQLAIELMDSKAPDTIKAAASRILDREAMVGTPLDLPATDGKGQPLTLAQFRGKVVVLYTWTGRINGSADWVQRMLAQGNAQVVFVGLNLDSDTGAAQAQLAKVAPNSIQIYDPTGPDGPVAASLHLTRCPSVYLLDRNGILQDVHGLDQFDAKLTKLLGVAHP